MESMDVYFPYGPVYDLTTSGSGTKKKKKSSASKKKTSKSASQKKKRTSKGKKKSSAAKSGDRNSSKLITQLARQTAKLEKETDALTKKNDTLDKKINDLPDIYPELRESEVNSYQDMFDILQEQSYYLDQLHDRIPENSKIYSKFDEQFGKQASKSTDKNKQSALKKYAKALFEYLRINAFYEVNKILFDTQKKFSNMSETAKRKQLFKAGAKKLRNLYKKLNGFNFAFIENKL